MNSRNERTGYPCEIAPHAAVGQTEWRGYQVEPYCEFNVKKD